MSIPRYVGTEPHFRRPKMDETVVYFRVFGFFAKWICLIIMKFCSFVLNSKKGFGLGHEYEFMA